MNNINFTQQKFISSVLLLFFALFATTSIYSQEKTNQQSFQEESLFHAGKIWGFVKYYHPEARLGKFDIDSSLVVLLDKVSETKNLKERNTVLSQWVASFGKITAFEKFVVKDSSQYKLFYDYSWLEDQSFDKKLSKQLIDIKNAKRTDSCYYSSSKNIPSFKNEVPTKLDFTKPYQKFIPFLRYWNIIEYYYPYKHLMDKRWDDVLEEYIPFFTTVKNEDDFNMGIRLLLSNTNDGHSSFNTSKSNTNTPRNKYYSPIELVYAKGRFIVKGLSPYFVTSGTISDYGLEIGDEIISIEGKDPNDIMKNEIAKYWGVSNFEYLCNSQYPSLLRSNNTSMNISYKRNGEIMNGKLKTGDDGYKDPVITPKEKIIITKDSIAYVNVEEISVNDVFEILYKIQKTKGLILDMRGYPDYFAILSLSTCLMPYRIPFCNISASDKSRPGGFKYEKSKLGDNYVGFINRNAYLEKVVIIVNNSTMSRSEYATMRFQQLPTATTIGSQTAGADGNVISVNLTDGLDITFSAIGIEYPKGQETQRVGVHIDEIVYPTPKGIKEGRDELVERAYEIIRSGGDKFNYHFLNTYRDISEFR